MPGAPEANNRIWPIFTSVIVASLGVGEYFAIKETLAYDRSLSGWLIGTLVAGPAIAALIVIPLMVIGCLIAMAKFPR